MTGDEALARARRAIGVPFRLHGRDLNGFDCVGLAAWSWALPAPTGYALRSAPADWIARELVVRGFARGPARPGAVLVAAPGPGQLHLGIASMTGIVHADAIARRVVERAHPLPWPILAAWMEE